MGAQAKVRGERRQRRERSRAIARQRRDERALQWAPVEYPEADRLAEPRRQPANRERPPAAGEPFLVPDYVARHRDPVVRALVARISLLYGRRKSFRTPLLNRQGGLLIPTFPELLQRPPKRRRKRTTRSKKHARTRTTRLNRRKTSSRRRRDFVWRRSDHMQAVMRVLLVLAACCDWISMEIMDPHGGYLSVARMAELAELPLKVTDPTDPEKRIRLRVSRTEHALQTLRIAGVLCFTKQYREVLDDGRHVSTGPALRKFAVGFFRKFGGQLLRIYESRKKKLKSKRLRDAPTTYDMRLAAAIRQTRLGLDGKGPRPPEPAGPLPRAVSTTTPPWMVEQIHEEHPDWDMPQIWAEARRRLERGPPPAAPPPNDVEPT